MISALDGSDLDALAHRVGGRLLRVEAPLRACLLDGRGSDCTAALASLRNPYAIEDEPGAFHTTGWLNGYDAGHSPYAVAAETPADIVAAVEFARDRGVGLVIKGTGHDYLGRSSGPGSLLIWTHRMREISVHDAFVPAGAGRSEPGVPAITLGAGTRWLEAYQALAPLGRYVQGGGCTSVGAAGGFTQGGGFGSFSRRFGTAAGNVLEAEVVTASGDVVIANAYRHSDLFWSLRGGGGGTFGVVSKLTMRTHPLPDWLGVAAGTITARSDDDFRGLVLALLRFLPSVCDDRWGEQIRLTPDNTAVVSMIAADVTIQEAQVRWEPLLDWIAARADTYTSDVSVSAVPFHMWDATAWDHTIPDMIRHDDRPGQPHGRFWWATNQGEVSQYLHAYGSRWLPRLLVEKEPDVLAEALFDSSRHWGISLHLNKALSGAAPDAVARDRTTSINPAVFDAAALVITASSEQYVYPGVPGHEPDRARGAAQARRVRKAMDILRGVTPGAGSYPNESDYFEPNWQHSFWGDNYTQLLEIKRTYDPTNLFRVHHGVGSDTPTA